MIGVSPPQRRAIGPLTAHRCGGNYTNQVFITTHDHGAVEREHKAWTWTLDGRAESFKPVTVQLQASFISFTVVRV